MILQEPVPRLIANLIDFERRNIKLLLVVVTDKDSSSNARVETQLAELKKKASIPIELRFYNLSDLEKEFEINP